MRRILGAFRAFFAVLFGRISAEQLDTLLSGTETAVPGAPPPASEVVASATSAPRRSEALALLAALQREGRFVDLVQEPLDQYSDAQIGAAARDVLRDCREVLSRMFALRPVMDGVENEVVETPTDVDAARWQLIGNVSGEPPFRGRLVHHGWEATQCNLPRWTGGPRSVRVVAPAQIECDL
jgi:hypothetical protein